MSDHVCGLSDGKRGFFSGDANVSDTERLASTAIGGFLLAFSVGQSSMVQRLMAVAAGGGLLYRGISGNCMMYRMLSRVRNDEGRQVAR